MISQTQNKPIDLNLVDLVCEHIPAWTWPQVKEQLVDAIVTEMPTHVIEKLTGDPVNDEGALNVLDEYYKPDERNKDLIVDAFKILGEEQTAYLLDSLQLNKIQQPTNRGTTTVADLSPAAQAVLDAFNAEARPEPHHQREAIAAALRAAADKIRFQDQLGLTAYGGFSHAQDQFLAIAIELEGTNPTNQED